MAVKTKQDRSRKSGHRQSEFIQDRPYVPPDPRQVLRKWMEYTPEMMRVWGSQWEGTEAKTVRAAIKNYIQRMERV